MCTWTNTRAGDNFDWLRKSESTQSISTGPASDHTIGTFLGIKESIFLLYSYSKLTRLFVRNVYLFGYVQGYNLSLC